MAPSPLTPAPHRLALLLLSMFTLACPPSTPDGTDETEDDTPEGSQAQTATPGTTPTASPGTPSATSPTEGWTATPSGTPTAEHTATPDWIGAPVYGELAITEFQPNPRMVSDVDGEWVEIYNAGHHTLDLTGVTLRITSDSVDEQGTLTPIGDRDMLLGPGQTAVLVSDADASTNGQIAGDFLTDINIPFLTVTLRLQLGATTLDNVVFSGTTWPYLEGHALAKSAIYLADLTQSNNPGAWCPSFEPIPQSTDFGSPGAMNVECGADEDGDLYPNPLDCDDNDPEVNPGSHDVDGDDIDNDCDGTVDEAPVAQPSAVVFSEIMPNPKAVDDTLGEWVELHNTGDSALNLQGWTFFDGSTAHVISESLALPAHGQIVLGVSTDVATNGGAPVTYAIPDLVMANSGDGLALWVDNLEIDRLDYVGAMFGSGVAGNLDPRHLTAEDNDLLAFWCYATEIYGGGFTPDKGTPGAPNTACQIDQDEDGFYEEEDCDDTDPNIHPEAMEIADNGIDEDCTGSDSGPPVDIVITEIMYDTAADAGAEWFELYNPNDVEANLRGWRFYDNIPSNFHIIAEDLLIPAGGHVVLGAADGGAMGAPLDYVYGNSTIQLSNNNGDQLYLVHPTATIVDELTFASSAPWPSVPAWVSIQLGLNATGLDNNVGAAWCASTTAYNDTITGTPGSENLTCPPAL